MHEICVTAQGLYWMFLDSFSNFFLSEWCDMAVVMEVVVLAATVAIAVVVIVVAITVMVKAVLLVVLAEVMMTKERSTRDFL